MVVKIKSAFWYKGKVYKKGDKVEVETSAFNPLLMDKVEIPEAIVKVMADEKTAKKTTRKKKG